MAMGIDALIQTTSDKLVNILQEETRMIRNVKDEFMKLASTVEIMKSALREAENESIKDTAINNWRAELRDIMYDADDILDRWNIEGKKSCGMPHSCFSTVAFRRTIAHEIKSLRGRLQHIVNNKALLHDPRLPVPNSLDTLRRESSHLPDPDVVGLADGTSILVEEMTREEWDERHLKVFAILGMGGIGKTTLAQQVYNHQRIKDGFPLRIWLCVSRNYSETELLKQMIRMSGGCHGPEEKKAELVQILTPLLRRTKLFLVLDDLWEAKVWVDLLRKILVNSEAKGRILVTSRLKGVAAGMGAVGSHGVQKLSDGDGWELLCKKVFEKGDEEVRENLMDIGMELVQKCDGLPLAICAVGGVLVTKRKLREDWEEVMQSKAWNEGDDHPDDLNRALFLSYVDLPRHLKPCFLYFSQFPEDFLFHDKELARLWVAEDFVQAEENQRRSMEEIAEAYYEELVKRHILQPNPRYLDNRHCTMHDLLRSLAAHLARKESFFGEVREAQGSINSGASIKLRRLSLVRCGKDEAIPEAVRRHKCLRTFMLFSSPATETVGMDLLQMMCRLRVLDLSWTGIKALPDSVGDLVQLRLLDLDGTGVTGLPESIGHLGSLQTLSLAHCESLQALPESISMLRSLRCLRIIETALSRVPAGIARLKQLNHLEGFVLGKNQGKGLRNGCRLEDLQPISELRFLRIDKLEAAQPGDPLLANKSCLRTLSLHCTVSSTSHTEPEMDRIERIFESLSPPQCLKGLTIEGFFGRAFPGWMQSCSSASLPNLTAIFLQNCASCSQLPPLGQLPELRSLTIVGASLITSVGPEFLGSSTRERPRSTSAAAFPSLEVLKMYEMPNWEEWSLDGRGVNKWLPRLKQLGLKDCPKLRNLPAGLRLATMLEILHIEKAHSLTRIEHLPSSPESLQLVENQSLEVISNLSAVRNLMIRSCESLTQVSGLPALRFLHLIDASMDGLPDWLRSLLEEQRQEAGGLQELKLECNDHLFLRCIEGAAYWKNISLVPRVTILTNYGCSAHLYYTKTPYSYKCNVHAC